MSTRIATLSLDSAPGEVATTCPYCGVGCGVLASRAADGRVQVRGDPAHPANRGALCVKGTALGETLGLQGRLLQPERRDAGAPAGFTTVGWDAALDEVASRFADTIAQHGPDAVALYVSGQLLTEDYYVANKFMKGFVGSANIDTNSRLCMASSVAGHRRAFGEDVVPVDYDDIEAASLLVLVGSNAAWCHPVLHRRIVAARERAEPLQVVVIDPRRTPTCDDADMHLPIRPGTDVMLFAGLLLWLADHGHCDNAFIAEHCAGFEHALAVARAGVGSVDHVARACGLPLAQLLAFYGLFAAHVRTVTLFSQGVNQSGAGTDKVNVILNCHLATGRIGRPGAGPFSITGQPNAMGGREVGGLANQLAAHLDLDHPGHRALVQAFWESPTMAQSQGLKAVELFAAVAAGRVRALWIIGTNPLVSLPDANAARAALERCDFVVVSDVVRDTETTRMAHLRLPALAWGEKDGTVTNSERCISRQRAFLPAPEHARADWWAIAQVARRMGYAGAFAYTASHEIFREHARLSAAGQQAYPRVFDLRALAQLDSPGYDALVPTRWPATRPFADGRFSHADGRARLVATWPRGPAHAPDDDHPFVLNTGRVRDHWHTMTRTGRAPTLAHHRDVPELELHPRDALAFGIVDGELAQVTSRWGSAVLRARTTTDVGRGEVFAPIHWNACTASDAGIDRVVNPVVDPVSGEPEFKHTPVRVQAFPVDWHGFALLRDDAFAEAGGSAGAALLAQLAALDATWWVRVQEPGCVAFHFAGRTARTTEAWRTRLEALVAHANDRAKVQDGVLEVPESSWMEYSDAAAGVHRAIAFAADGGPAGTDGGMRVLACVFVAPTRAALPPSDWLAARFGDERRAHARASWLRGVPADAAAGPRAGARGAVVCACHGVREGAIDDALRLGQADSVEGLGAALRCGTNCGSCLPELRRRVREHADGRT